MFGKIFSPLRQLKWKIIAGHMVVVLVGVLTLSLVGEVILLRTVRVDLEGYLTTLVRTDDPRIICAD